jgi:DNA processing protein
MSLKPAPACDRCLTRAWLVGRLAGHLEQVRGRIPTVLELGDDDLIAAVGGDRQGVVRRELQELDLQHERVRCADAGLETICRCDSAYPSRLKALAAPPAVLHVSGQMERFLQLVNEEPVAVVGSRRPSPYGLEIARTLGRELSSARITLVSGMALGIDSAAHRGALDAGAPTVAILPAGADRPYPASKRALHREICAAGAAVSELPPGTAAWRWTFPARNRIIAALAAMTVVVEAGERSGALLTAGFAKRLRRPVGAVPGRVTSPQSAGSNELLSAGAYVVRGAGDILDLLYGVGVRRPERDRKPELAPELRVLLAAIARGSDTPGALERAGFPAEQTLGALASLELAGYVRREPGGRFSMRS